MVQLITKAIVKILEDTLGAKEVLFGAGKFLMIAKSVDGLKDIEKELNDEFFKKYFGESGVVLNYIETTKSELENQNSSSMKETLINLGRKNEEAKYQKFANNLKEPIIKTFENAKKDDEICEFCKKRVAKDSACEVCANEIKLGTLLTKKDYMKIEIKNSIENNEVLILRYKGSYFVAKFVDNEDEAEYDISNMKMKKLPKWPLKSYVPMKNEEIKTFEEIEGESSGLMVLKADVDRLGKTFRDFYFESFKKFNRLSRELNFFFANYVPYLIASNEKYKDNIYIVFAGGDDLFMIGRYDVIVEFAKELREKFVKFSLNKATLSMGLVMFKSSTPIAYVSEWADEAEKKAKKVKKDGIDRDGICIFDKAMKFDEFIEIEKRIKKLLGDEINMSVLYKLIEIIKMASNMKKPENALWISKLFYLSKRRGFNEVFVKEFRDLIEEYKNKLLPSIYLKIYERRDNARV
jgi:CRISPR-associated protein Csm1